MFLICLLVIKFRIKENKNCGSFRSALPNTVEEYKYMQLQISEFIMNTQCNIGLKNIFYLTTIYNK